MSDAGRPDPGVRDGEFGFVVAMRALIWRRYGAPSKEWIIVSRWGEGGMYLSLARTLVPAPGNEPLPIGLAPRHTALAILSAAAADIGQQRFLLARTLPDGITVAGRFLALDGCLGLRGDAGTLRLHGRGICRDSRTWRLGAARVPWIDEFLHGEPGVA